MRLFTRKCVFIIAILACGNVQAQNLVPNFNFETYTSLPSGYGQITKCPPWYSALFSVDYFHASATSTGVDVPANYFGNQAAYSGNAYAGIARSQAGSYHEYLGIQLSSPLTIGQTYYVEAQVSPGEGPYKWGTNNYGFFFSTYQLMGGATNQPILKTPHVNWTSPITNYSVWNTISGTFVADSAYTHLTMGNFFSTAATTWVDLGAGGGISSMFWYIEDVAVQPMSVLPVELVEFDANPFEKTDVRVNWTTVSELNSDRFDIERSVDGKDFRIIGTIKAAGNSSSTIEYELIDEPGIFDQPIYYRLKQVDNDGAVHYSDLKDVVLYTPKSDQLLSVYPNPIEQGNVLTIEWYSTSHQEVHAQIYDQTGRLAFSFTQWAMEGTNVLNQDLPELATGNYLLKLSTGDVVETSKLLIK